MLQSSKMKTLPTGKLAGFRNSNTTRTVYSMTAVINQPLSATVQAAQTYTQCGWKVFPLKQGLKTPATRSGFKDATTDLDQISQWFDNGVHNGPVSTKLS
jgi:hypothetical protein